MRVLVQRVARAEVRVKGATVGAIEQGLLLLVGVSASDTMAEVTWLANKIAGLRIFADEVGKLNLSLLEVGGGALVVSQFTLYGDCQKGRRPSFVQAAPSALAKPLVAEFQRILEALGVTRVASGEFGADMAVELINDGPVTLWLERESSADENTQREDQPHANA